MMLKKRNRWKIYYALLLLVTALYFDRGFCATGDYPVLARDTDGYNVVDLNGARAEASGRLNVDILRVGSLTVTNSASLPTSGTVPIHPIFGYHDTNATGAQLNTLTGGILSEGSGLHNHYIVRTGTDGTFQVRNRNTEAVAATVSDLGIISGTSITAQGAIGRVGSHVPGQLEYAWFPLDDTGTMSTVHDSTEHFGVTMSNSVTCNGMTVTGLLGNAFHFDMTKDPKLYTVTYQRQIGKDFSIAFWIKSFDDNAFGRYAGYGPNIQYRVYTDGSNNFISVVLINNTGAIQTVNSIATVPSGVIGNWTHVVVQKRGAKMEVFFNSALAFSGTASAGTFDFNGVSLTTPNIFIGGVTGNYHDCYIDDWRMYRFALSPAQIAALYNGGTGTTSPMEAVTSVDGALSLPSRSGYVAEVRNIGNSTAYKGIKVQAGENTASANNEMLGCYEGDGDQRGALVIDSSRNVAIWNVSDARVKTGIKETTKDALGTLSKVKVYDYKLKDAGTLGFGFLAQEIASAAPESGGVLDIQEMQDTSSTLGVLKTDNGTTLTLSDGRHFQKSDPGIKIEGTHVVRYAKVPVRVQRPGVIQTALIPYLWKIAQLQQAQITALKARVTTLEAKVKRQ